MRYAAGEAREWARASLSGYVTILYTPFHADGALDEAGLRHNVRRTIAMPGVGGPSVHSLHQEFWALTLAERKRVTEIVLEEATGRLPVMVGCFDPAAANVVELARHARMMERVGDRICVSTSLEEYFLFGRLTFAERTPRFMIGSSPALAPPDPRDVAECVAVLRRGGLLAETA
jgi:hypothetical protein